MATHQIVNAVVSSTGNPQGSVLNPDTGAVVTTLTASFNKQQAKAGDTVITPSFRLNSLGHKLSTIAVALDEVEAGDVLSIEKSTDEITWVADNTSLADNAGYSWVRGKVVLDLAGTATRQGTLTLTMTS